MKMGDRSVRSHHGLMGASIPGQSVERTTLVGARVAMKRIVLGTLGGAVFGGVIAATIPSVLIGAILLFEVSRRE
jgi:hypothetical protein